MRYSLLALALLLSPAAVGGSLSEEFGNGFGGVAWGTRWDDLLQRFPGGYQLFSTATGGLSYTVNIDDPVFGFQRRGLYVKYSINPARLIDEIEVQLPYEQASAFIALLTQRFGPAIGPELERTVTRYRWPRERGFSLGLRLWKDGGSGLATIWIRQLVQPAPGAGTKPR